MARLVVMKKGGGGKVAVNPDQVGYVRSSTSAFTDIFIDGQQVTVEGSFDEVVARLAPFQSAPAAPPPPERDDRDDRHGLIFSRN